MVKREQIPSTSVALGCVHISTSTSPVLYGFPYTSSGKHEFVRISVAAVYMHMSTGYL